jgi:hypothetical protein
LKKEDVKPIDDVESKDKVYNFSDGCGYVSPQVMKKVCEVFEVYQASAIQMRFGEYKGVLVEHKDLTGETVEFRDSMKKFD